MFEIAGGIIIAVVALYLLPLVILALPWIILGAVGLLLLVLGIEFLASLSEEEALALIGTLVVFLGGVVLFCKFRARNARRARSALGKDKEALATRTSAGGDTHP